MNQKKSIYRIRKQLDSLIQSVEDSEIKQKLLEIDREMDHFHSLKIDFK